MGLNWLYYKSFIRQDHISWHRSCSSIRHQSRSAVQIFFLRSMSSSSNFQRMFSIFEKSLKPFKFFAQSKLWDAIKYLTRLWRKFVGAAFNAEIESSFKTILQKCISQKFISGWNSGNPAKYLSTIFRKQGECTKALPPIKLGRKMNPWSFQSS